jgi:hypothetical protein
MGSSNVCSETVGGRDGFPKRQGEQRGRGAAQAKARGQQDRGGKENTCALGRSSDRDRDRSSLHGSEGCVQTNAGEAVGSANAVGKPAGAASHSAMGLSSLSSSTFGGFTVQVSTLDAAGEASAGEAGMPTPPAAGAGLAGLAGGRRRVKWLKHGFKRRAIRAAKGVEFSKRRRVAAHTHAHTHGAGPALPSP